MDSLYEPVKENKDPQETICMTSRANTPVSASVKCGPPERSQSLVSDTKSKLSLCYIQCVFFKHSSYSCI